MKNTLLLILSIALMSFSGENNPLKTKLQEVYSSEMCEQILQNEQQVNYFNVLVFQSVQLMEVKATAMQSHPLLKEIPMLQKDGTTKKITSKELEQLIQSKKFNGIQLQLERDFEKNLYFQLENSSYILVLLSHSQINKLATK